MRVVTALPSDLLVQAREGINRLTPILPAPLTLGDHALRPLDLEPPFDDVLRVGDQLAIAGC